MEPVVDGLKQEYSGRVEFKKVDFYANRDLARANGVLGHPTLVIRRQDGTMVKVLPGVPTREVIAEALDEAVK